MKLTLDLGTTNTPRKACVSFKYQVFDVFCYLQQDQYWYENGKSNIKERWTHKLRFTADNTGEWRSAEMDTDYSMPDMSSEVSLIAIHL